MRRATRSSSVRPGPRTCAFWGSCSQSAYAIIPVSTPKIGSAVLVRYDAPTDQMHHCGSRDSATSAPRSGQDVSESVGISGRVWALPAPDDWLCAAEYRRIWTGVCSAAAAAAAAGRYAPNADRYAANAAHAVRYATDANRRYDGSADRVRYTAYGPADRIWLANGAAGHWHDAPRHWYDAADYRHDAPGYWRDAAGYWHDAADDRHA